MIFERVTLRNVRCYESADLELDPGVTVIHGPNGSGKTTILEACFFALYGARALEETLDQFVTTGAEEAAVTLWFRHAGTAYRVHRRIRVSGDQAQTAECVLEAPEETIDGARDVRRRITALLRMDADAFVNCAYVRQGEINELIHATPATRQRIIDDLLQLGALEEYRERAGDARLAVEDRLGELRGKLSGIEERIEAKEAKDLHDQLNELESKLTTVENNLEDLDDRIEETEATREEAIEVIESYEEKRSELADLEERIDDLRERITETESQRTALDDQLDTLRERREDLRERRDTHLSETSLDDDVDSETIESAIDAVETDIEDTRDTLKSTELEIQEAKTAIETATDRAEELVAEAETKRETATELAAELEEDEATLEERRERRASLEAQREDLEATLDAAPVDRGDAETLLADREAQLDSITEELADARAERDQVRERINRAERLRDEGRCPECGQPVEDAPHVETLEDDRERKTQLEETIADLEARRDELEAARETAEDLVEIESTLERLDEQITTTRELIDDRETTIADKRERIETLRREAEDLEQKAEEQRERATAQRERLDDLTDTVARLNRRQQTHRSRKETLEALKETIDTLVEIDEQMTQLRERRSLLTEQNDERRETLAELQEQRQDLRRAYDEQRLEEATQAKHAAEETLETLRSNREEYATKRDELQNAIGAVRGELEELESLRDQQDALVERRDALEHVHEEVSELEALYSDLRSELRQRNVSILEELLNETFGLVYRADAYDRIELSDTYELTVYQKDGEPLDPEQLSGGERALFNLSLRAGIYRLLAEGIDGAAPMPPLILDEPTVFLDTGHVTQLVELIGVMQELGVDQIIVVSHDEELIDAADDLVEVHKDPTTNRSELARRTKRALIGE